MFDFGSIFDSVLVSIGDLLSQHIVQFITSLFGGLLG